MQASGSYASAGGLKMTEVGAPQCPAVLRYGMFFIAMTLVHGGVS